MATGYVGTIDDRPPEPKRFKTEWNQRGDGPPRPPQQYDDRGPPSQQQYENRQHYDNRFIRDDGVDPTNPDPSIVVHVRNLSPRATEADLLEALTHFGPIAYATCMQHKKMALVEFEHLEGARACVQFAATKPINVAGQPAQFNYSTSKMIQRIGLESEKPNKVLILTIYNAQYPITVDVINEICSTHGVVKRIAIIRRSMLQALVEFENVDQAKAAKHSMNGADIYSGCCTLKVEYAKPDTVKVTHNSAEQFDYTCPDNNGPAPPSNPRKTLLQAEGGDAAGRYPPADGYGRSGYDRGAPPRGGYRDEPYGGPPARDDYYGGGRGGYAGRGGYDRGGYEGYGRGGPPVGRGGRGSFADRGGYQGRGGYGGYDRGGYAAGAGGRFGGGSSVLMLYGITHEALNCDKVFNILCQYGNVERVKFMLKKTDTCMVEMGHPAQVTSALSYLQDMEMFGLKLTLRPSKQTEVREQGVPFEMPDGSPSFRDYSQSRNQRYSTPDLAVRNRVCAPMTTIHWFNAPPNIDEERIEMIFKESGAPLPTKVIMNPAKSERSRAGIAEFATVKDANEALALANHTPVASPVSKVPFIVKMAYYAPGGPGPRRFGDREEQHE